MRMFLKVYVPFNVWRKVVCLSSVDFYRPVVYVSVNLYTRQGTNVNVWVGKPDLY